MPKIAPTNPLKLVKLLEKDGFRQVRRKGSHVILMDKNRTRIVVPVHSGKQIKPGLVRAIIREAGITREKFFKLLKKS